MKQEHRANKAQTIAMAAQGFWSSDVDTLGFQGVLGDLRITL